MCPLAAIARGSSASKELNPHAATQNLPKPFLQADFDPFERQMRESANLFAIIYLKRRTARRRALGALFRLFALGRALSAQQAAGAE
jgi:hypothetical protein